ncbi:MAG TPA: hypothetical protein VJA23_01160 [Candidatus Nanoarchaeia archaeon]|nr:hypothetical protein [Candidatus Nanoarchaeia archaeon]
MCIYGWKGLVFCLLLLLNVFVWPLWQGVDGWIAYLAVLGVLWCLLTLIWPKWFNDNGYSVKAPAKKKK